MPRKTVKKESYKLVEIPSVSFSTVIAEYPVSIVPIPASGTKVKLILRHENIKPSDIEEFRKDMHEQLKNCDIVKEEIINTGKRKVSVTGIHEGISSLDAAKLWFESRKISDARKECLLARIENYLRGHVGSSEVVSANAFSIRNVDVDGFMPFPNMPDATPNKIVGIDDGVIGVLGKYDGADGRSNRSGKSAFMESILFALYGEGRKVSSMDKLVHNNGDHMYVGIRLDGTKVGDNEPHMFDIEREWHKGISELKIDGNVWKVKDGTDEIKKIVGLGFADFVRTCFVRQGDLKGVLGQDSAKMKSDIIRWRGLGVWEDIEKLVKADVVDLESRIQSDKIELNLLKEEYNFLDAKDLTQERFEILMTDKCHFEVQLEERNKDEVKLSGLKERWKFINRLGEIRKKLLPDVTAREEQKTRLTLEIADFTRKLREEQNDLVLSQKERKMYEEGIAGCFPGVCPVDKNRCPRTDEINGNKDNTKLKAELARVQEKILERKSNIDKWDKTIDEFKRVLKTVETLLTEHYQAETILKQNDKVEDVDTIDIEMRKCEKALSEVNKEIVTSKLQAVQKEIIELQYNIDKKKDLFGRISEYEFNLADQTNQLDEFRLLLLACGKNGIPYVQMEQSILEIESVANQILESIGTDNRLRFEFETELKKKEVACSKCGRYYESGEDTCTCGEKRGKEKSDKLSVLVMEGDRTQELDLDSGGGTALLALAVRIALAKMFGATVLFLDEVCSALDEANMIALLQMLNNLKQFGFNQVFLISHRPEIAETIGKNILVTRHHDSSGNWSEVEWLKN